MTTIEAAALVPGGLPGGRFDQVAAQLFPQHSRENLKRWILAGALTRNGEQASPSVRVRAGDSLRLLAVLEPREDWRSAQDVPFAVVAERDDWLVIDKPAGVVVHPGAGARDHTLVNGLLARYPSQATLPRAGIVHRLDKDTSGLMLVARTPRAHTYLVRALAARTIDRRYLAIATGELRRSVEVDVPIGRHPTHRTRMAVRNDGRAARTSIRPLARVDGFTLVEAKLHSGRTHQIRVHLAHLGHPLLGDVVYGSGSSLLGRQALHAYRLVVPPGDPGSTFLAGPPPDLCQAAGSLGIDIDQVMNDVVAS